jgi:hypothetical protein
MKMVNRYWSSVKLNSTVLQMYKAQRRAQTDVTLQCRSQIDVLLYNVKLKLTWYFTMSNSN